MPLVFVHGVNTRRGATAAEEATFDNRVRFFGEQFKRVALVDQVFGKDGIAVFAPYWGDLGIIFAKDLACLPGTNIEALAGVIQPERHAATIAAAAFVGAEPSFLQNIQDEPLLGLAHARSLVEAVELLFGTAANAVTRPLVFPTEVLDEVLPEAAKLGEEAFRYAEANPHPAWLSDIADDDAFVEKLLQVLSTQPDAIQIQSLGFGDKVVDWFKNAARAVKQGVRAAVEATKDALVDTGVDVARASYMKLSASLRPVASQFIGRFFGDVFTYMENRQPIIDRVLADIAQAEAARKPGDDKLFLVGHSFGGIILYDILTHFRPDLDCDLYITVGSQVALFAEIGRLAEKQAIVEGFNGPTGLAPRPAAARRWINVFDSTDLVGFATRGVFSGAWDLRFETNALPIVSHGAYFDTPRLYVRLRERINQAMQQGTDKPL